MCTRSTLHSQRTHSPVSKTLARTSICLFRSSFCLANHRPKDGEARFENGTFAEDRFNLLLQEAEPGGDYTDS